MRNMIRPFKNGMLNQACPISEILTDLNKQLEELRVLKLRVAEETEGLEMAPS